MGKTYKELKGKIAQLRGENSFLTSKIEKVILENGRVKRELQVSNARMIQLAQELELLKNGLPFADEVKKALNYFVSAHDAARKTGLPQSNINKTLHAHHKTCGGFIWKFAPDGMVYDEESDSLVKKVCVNQMCQGEFCDCDDSHSFKK